MSANYSPVYVRARELLADGEWHDYRKLVSELTRLVPPGWAMRRAEAQRLSTARRKNYNSVEERKVQRDPDRIIRFGAATIVRQVLTNSRVFEISPRGVQSRDAEKKIRWIGEPVTDVVLPQEESAPATSNGYVVDGLEMETDDG